MKLSVLSVAYGLAPVGPDSVGGAEQVLGSLDRALVEAGHHSIVIACRGSKVNGELIATPNPPGLITDDTRRHVWAAQRQAIADVLHHRKVDVVHMHGVDFHHYLSPLNAPVLVTLHLPCHCYPAEIFNLHRPSVYLHCVSASQQRTCPTGRPLLPVIENGVAVDGSIDHVRRRRYALALARICPEKGLHLALEAAHRADVDLLIAGQVHPYESHQRYFQEEIAPRLDRRRRFIGPVGPRRKWRLLAGARCLIAPSLIAETSSLVAMEAIACGTPVVALPAGALAEVVSHGRTGLLVHNVREMAEAIASIHADQWAHACRIEAATRFSHRRMVEAYLQTYHRLAARRTRLLHQRLGA